MLLETSEFRSAQLPARLQAYHDFRDTERQERITVKGQIRLEPRRTGQQAENAALDRPKPKGRIIRGAKREHVVRQIAATLNEAPLTKFQREAACRHGMRAQLCLDGEAWHEADTEAANLVAEALASIHAQRPSYDEGQREYSVSPDYCSWCHSPLEDVPGTRKVSYCDETCARAAMQAREINHHRHETRAFSAAWDVVQRSRHALCDCEECGKSFRPLRLNMANRFCSLRCSNENKARTMSRPERTCPTCQTTFRPATSTQVHCSPRCGFDARKTVPECNCAHCGKEFRPKSNARADRPNRFCSKACHYAHGHSQYSSTCNWCGTGFIAKARVARICSDACRIAERKYRLGTLPQLLAVHVFDHFVTVPALAANLRERLDP